MSDDRELLELAARAADVFLTPETMAAVFPGFEWDEGDAPEFDDDDLIGTVVWHGEDGKPAGTEKMRWNPLLDDGDAFRLAVKLRIDVYTLPINGEAVTVTAKHRMRSDLLRQPNPTASTEMLVRDPYAATRRAIVRAAAEIGRQL